MVRLVLVHHVFSVPAAKPLFLRGLLNQQLVYACKLPFIDLRRRLWAVLDVKLTLPAAPLPDDIVDRVAKEVAKHVADHIRFMYPQAAEAVSWDSASLSIHGIIRNCMAEAGRAAEEGRIDQCLKDMRKRRLEYRKIQMENV